MREGDILAFLKGPMSRLKANTTFKRTGNELSQSIQRHLTFAVFAF